MSSRSLLTSIDLCRSRARKCLVQQTQNGDVEKYRCADRLTVNRRGATATSINRARACIRRDKQSHDRDIRCGNRLRKRSATRSNRYSTFSTFWLRLRETLTRRTYKTIIYKAKCHKLQFGSLLACTKRARDYVAV